MLSVGDVQWEYFVFVLDSVVVFGQCMVVIVLYGFELDVNGLCWLMCFDGVVEVYGMVMVYLNVENKSWNVGKGFGSKNKMLDDIGFMCVFVVELLLWYGFDVQWFYVMGFFNGGQFVVMMVCELVDCVVVVGIVVQMMNIDGCVFVDDVFVVLIYGVKDLFVLFDGGGLFELCLYVDLVVVFCEFNEMLDVCELFVNVVLICCESFGKGIE